MVRKLRGKPHKQDLREGRIWSQAKNRDSEEKKKMDTLVKEIFKFKNIKEIWDTVERAIEIK